MRGGGRNTCFERAFDRLTRGKVNWKDGDSLADIYSLVNCNFRSPLFGVCQLHGQSSSCAKQQLSTLESCMGTSHSVGSYWASIRACLQRMLRRCQEMSRITPSPQKEWHWNQLIGMDGIRSQCLSHISLGFTSLGHPAES